MNKLRQILQFIRALLGFLLNLKKKERDEKKEKVVTPGNQPEVARVLPGDTGDDGFVGGPYRNRPGLDRGPVDTLGVRKRLQGELAQRFRKESGLSLTVLAGYALMVYAAGRIICQL
ncbi:hypothetical protein NBH15_13575 [Parabacteroides sp. W1-Q-101]|uniref:hypothetical protein n=1 Tax=Parabacteroides TaxID=375288 RepID=UPI00202F215B|nr:MULTISPECIES: hypothetical protein [Parabacteroides]MCM0719302.1 hypothetical protein [Parabacteroides sp. W1-Q-101]